MLRCLLVLSLATCNAGQPTQPAPDPAQITKLEPCDGFDFPVGRPNAVGYYNAQKFGENAHLGDDWNGTGGGNSDLGDPVYAAADGIVISTKDHKRGWGNVVIVRHNIGTADLPLLYDSVYAHLDAIAVRPGQKLRRGGNIGTIGTAGGRYLAHLHFEIRPAGTPLGSGYGEPNGHVDPTLFIQRHRPSK